MEEQIMIPMIMTSWRARQPVRDGIPDSSDEGTKEKLAPWFAVLQMYWTIKNSTLKIVWYVCGVTSSLTCLARK